MTHASDIDQVILKVPTNGEFAARDFSAFLYRIKALHTYFADDSKFVEEIIDDDIEALWQDNQQLVQELQYQVQRDKVNNIRYQLFSRDLGENDLYIKSLEDGSIEIGLLSGLTGWGVPVMALIVVLIILATITGGSFSIGPSGITFEAGETLGKSLQDLKEFFR